MQSGEPNLWFIRRHHRTFPPNAARLAEFKARDRARILDIKLQFLAIGLIERAYRLKGAE
jgi:hypothetical protein